MYNEINNKQSKKSNEIMMDVATTLSKYIFTIY